jgi:polycomb protein EED
MKGRPTDEKEETNDKNQEEEEEEIMPQELQRRPIKEANVIYIDDSSDEDYREVIETIPSATNQHPTNKHMLELNSTNHDMDIQDETTAKSPLASSRTSSDRNSSGRVEYSFHYYHMATCGGNFLTLYQLKVPDRNNKSGKRGTFINNTGNSVNTCINSTLIYEEECEDFVVRQVYKDVDVEENFFTCTFAGRSRRQGAKVYLESSDDENAFGPQLCCVGGKQGLIKVIDTVKQSLIFTLVGHTDELYDMKRCPVNEWLLLSASNDETIRLWNLKYPSQIAIFAGHQGHREAVLSIDWHPFGKYFASSGMDGTIRLWSIEEPNVQNAIEKSFKSPLLVEEISSCCFKTVYHQIPFWITSKMHTDYVDCIYFVGDLILSKSTTNIVSLWKPIFCVSDKNQSIESNDTSSSTSSNNEVLHLLDYSVPDCGQWYIRFGVDSDCNLLAVGNCIGDIRVWEIGGAKKPNIVFNAMCSAIVRMTAFSPDGKMMVAVCDDSTVWKYRIS